LTKQSQFTYNYWVVDPTQPKIELTVVRLEKELKIGDQYGAAFVHQIVPTKFAPIAILGVDTPKYVHNEIINEIRQRIEAIPDAPMIPSESEDGSAIVLRLNLERGSTVICIINKGLGSLAQNYAEVFASCRNDIEILLSQLPKG
jgi:hypothetical protein